MGSGRGTLAVGGGFFTGRYRSMGESVEAGVRFDDSSTQGKVRRPPLPPPPTHL